MLSYLHAFHAGNFADVQKHAALVLALRMMQAKPSAIACFDTHGGSALYRLDGERARKTAEADGGIQKLWSRRTQLTCPDWSPLLERLAALNPATGPLVSYPGSPAWFRHFLRQQDALSVFELHPGEGEALAHWAQQQGVRVQRDDGLEGLVRALPARAPRLLVLVDPSYEVKSDYQQVGTTLNEAWRLSRHGVYLIWYPLLASGLDAELKAAIRGGPVRKVLCSEWRLSQPPERGMAGTGLLVVNPPWGFAERLEAMLTDASEVAGIDASHSLGWLVPE